MYPIIFLTQEEMKARWDKDLCYTCDEVYSFEHRCATIQLYMLKDEEECVEGEVETTEIVFDSGGGLIEVPDPEDSPIKANSGSANSGSDLVSPILNLLELEGVEPEASTILDFTAKKSVREVSDETPPLEAVQELPDENLEVEAVEDLPEEKPSEETNVKWLEKPSIVEIKRVEKLQEASAKVSIDAKGNTQPISITPHNQNLSTLSGPNQNTPPIQTQIFHAINQNTAANLVANRPNPWPNKLPKLTYFIRPKPWPDEPPIHTTTNTNRPTLWPGAIGNFGSPKPRNNIEENNKEGKAYHVLKRVHHRLWPTLERAAAAARLPTPFPGEDRRRSRPVSQLMVLPEFDPGDFRLKEDKGRISFEFNGYLGHFGRIFEGNRRRIEENSRWFSEKRRIGIVLEENRRQIEEEVVGLSKKKKIWANSELGIWIEDLGD